MPMLGADLRGSLSVMKTYETTSESWSPTHSVGTSQRSSSIFCSVGTSPPFKPHSSVLVSNNLWSAVYREADTFGHNPRAIDAI